MGRLHNINNTILIKKIYINPTPGPPKKMSINHFESFFCDSKGKDFLIVGVTDPMKSFFAKFFHSGTPQDAPKLKRSHFSEFKIFEKRHFLASNPLETINTDM